MAGPDAIAAGQTGYFRPVARAAQGEAARLRQAGAAGDASAQGQDRASPPGTPANQRNLTEEQQRAVRELQKIDAEVRQHEQAHKTAGGPYAGAIQYQYTTGPDGRRYVTGGEVPIDVSPVRGDPEATITKMEVVKRAALAPAEPSPQDRAVAAQADATRAQAQQDLIQQRGEEAEGGGDGQAAGAGGTAAAPGGDAVRQARAAAAYGRQPPTRPAVSLVA